MCIRDRTQTAAKLQRLTLGDTLPVARGENTLTLVGIWVANDPADAAWHGDPAVASGMNGGAIGPAVVAAGSLSELPVSPSIIWQVSPGSVASAGDTLAVISAWQRALSRIEGLPGIVDEQRQNNTRVSGDLGETLQRQASAIAATQGLIAVPLLVLALLGCLVLSAVMVLSLIHI